MIKLGFESSSLEDEPLIYRVARLLTLELVDIFIEPISQIILG